MLSEDQFIDGKFTWFIGVVEDITDPEKMNRVRVRCFGYHTQDKGMVPTADLPWATVMLPTTSASFKGVGKIHELVVGSWVVGFFRDGSSSQDPVVMGSIASKTEDVLDLPTQTQENYPNNKVHVTEGGHIIEYDNTVDAKRINIQHSSGTTININNDGTVEINSANTTVNIIGNTSITGTLNVSGTTHSVGDVSTDAGKGLSLAGHTHETQITPGSSAGTYESFTGDKGGAGDEAPPTEPTEDE